MNKEGTLLFLFLVLISTGLVWYINYYECECKRKIRFNWYDPIGTRKICKCGIIWIAEDGYATKDKRLLK